MLEYERNEVRLEEPPVPLALEVHQLVQYLQRTACLGVRQGFQVRVAPEQDRGVRLEGPTAWTYPYHLAGSELVVERSLVPGCAGVEFSNLSRELGMRRERTGSHLEVLSAHGAALLFPHQAPEPRVAPACERHRLAVYQGVRRAVLVHEQFLHVLKGVAYETVRLVALLLLLDLALRTVRELHTSRGLVKLCLAAQGFPDGPIAVIVALPFLAVVSGVSKQGVYPCGVSPGPERQHPAQRQVRLGMTPVTARVSVPQPEESLAVCGC